MKNATSGEIRLLGLSGWTATVRGNACAVDATDGSCLSIRFAGRPVYRLPMTLRPPQGQPFDVIVSLVGRDAVIALADGTILSPGDKSMSVHCAARSPCRLAGRFLSLARRVPGLAASEPSWMANSPLESSQCDRRDARHDAKP